MIWSWLFPARSKPTGRPADTPPDAGEASIPALSVGPVGGHAAAPVASAAAPTDAGAAAAVGAAFLLGAELAQHGQLDPSGHPAAAPSHAAADVGAQHPGGPDASAAHTGDPGGDGGMDGIGG